MIDYIQNKYIHIYIIHLEKLDHIWYYDYSYYIMYNIVFHNTYLLVLLLFVDFDCHSLILESSFL